MKNFLKYFVLTLSLYAMAGDPAVALAQGGPFVPVVDIRLNPKFDRYLRMFETFQADFDDTFGDATPDGTTDSLRDLISGSDPQGIAAEECATRGTIDEVVSWEDGPWEWALASTSAAGNAGDLYAPHELEGLQVNKSASLRCLLQELVEWEKLGLNLQIHALLKQYISDAQTKQLGNQLRDEITAANLNWAKRGIEVNNAGVVTTQPVYITNVNRYVLDRTGREVEDVTDRVAASPTDPEGSYNMCEDLKMRTAQSVASNMRDNAQDPFDTAKSRLECSADKPGIGIVGNQTDMRYLHTDPGATQGPGVLETLQNMYQQPQNWDASAAGLARDQAGRQVRSATYDFEKQLTPGVLGTEECSGVQGDPRCVTANRTITSPSGARNADTISRMSGQGTRQIEEGDTLSQHATGEAPEDQDNLISTGGLLNYDTQPLAEQETAVNMLVKEFNNVIDFAYFDTSYDPAHNGGNEPGDDSQEIPFHTREWGIATMLMIYDEMRFDQANPSEAWSEQPGGDTLYFDP